MVKSVRLKRKEIHPRRRITLKKQNTKRKKQVGGRRKTRKRKRKQKSKKQYGGQPVDKTLKRIDHSLEVEQYYHGFQTEGDINIIFNKASTGAYLLFVDSGGSQFLLKIAIKGKKNNVEILPVEGVPQINQSGITEFNHNLRRPIKTFISSNKSKPKLKNPFLVRNIDINLREAFLKRKFPNASQNKDYLDVTTLPYFHFTNLRDIPLNSYGLFFSNFNNLLFLKVRYLHKESGPTVIFIGIAKTIDGKYIALKYQLERSVPITGSHLPSIHDVVKFIIAYLNKYSAQTEITPFNKDKVLTINDQEVKLFQSKPGRLDYQDLQKYGKIGDYLIFQKGLDEYEIYYKGEDGEFSNKENQTIEDIESILNSQKLKNSLTREELSDMVNIKRIFYEPFSKKGKSGEYMLYTDFHKNAEIFYKEGEDLKTSPSFPLDNQQAIKINNFLANKGLLPKNLVDLKILSARDF